MLGIGSGTITAKEYTAAASGGAWLQILTAVTAAVVMQVYIKPDNETTMYDFKIKDTKDREIYHKKNITGTLNELDKHPPMTQSLGPYKLQIVNSSLAGEIFDVLVMLQEIR